MRRRDFLRYAIALPAAGLSLPSAFAAAKPAASIGKPQPFDYAWLKGMARTLSSAAYQPPNASLPPALAGLNYDSYRSILNQPAHALWAKEELPFRIQFFSLGYLYKERVRMHEVLDGQAAELAFNPSMFDFSKSGVDPLKLPPNLGYAGFRLNFHTDWVADVAAFLGVSYFRAVGEGKQYGMSARGLAIDTGMETPEEFPRFTAYWFERPRKDANRVSIYALLESRSVTGAYRFDITPGTNLLMDLDVALYPRTTIERLGVAPLTSMYLCGENDKRLGYDWRPEIHDSDGLSIATSYGQTIWRPLVNSIGPRVNSYFDNNPRGFGLLQRDRNFDHYQDDGVYYHRRPSVWVEPRAGSGGGQWGKGAVQLVELSAPDETYDNIVAYWTPTEKPQAGQELLYSYRLYWGERMPVITPLGQVVATRTGLGGAVGIDRKYFSWKFAVDFVGGDLSKYDFHSNVEAVVTASRGTLEIVSARPLHELNGYRAMFDIRPTDESLEPINLTLFLRINDKPLTESWFYQWTPPTMAQREAELKRAMR